MKGRSSLLWTVCTIISCRRIFCGKWPWMLPKVSKNSNIRKAIENICGGSCKVVNCLRPSHLKRTTGLWHLRMSLLSQMQNKRDPSKRPDHARRVKRRFLHRKLILHQKSPQNRRADGGRKLSSQSKMRLAPRWHRMARHPPRRPILKQLPPPPNRNEPGVLENRSRNDIQSVSKKLNREDEEIVDHTF